MLYLAYRLSEAVKSGGVMGWGDPAEQARRSSDAQAAVDSGDDDEIEAFLDSLENGPFVLAEELSYHVDFLDPRLSEIAFELESTAEFDRAGDLFEDFAPGTIDAFEDALLRDAALAAYIDEVRSDVEKFGKQLGDDKDDDDLTI